MARTLWDSSSKLKSAGNIPTHLTQQHRREAKGQPPLPPIEVPRLKHLCTDCGVEIPSGNKLCSSCAKQATDKNFHAGRKSAQQPKSIAKRSATQRQHEEAIRNWKPSDLPGWLTRDLYLKQVQPALASVAKARIRLALGVSEPYSSDIRAGKRIPHRRHWQTLARLVGCCSERIGSTKSQGRTVHRIRNPFSARARERMQLHGVTGSKRYRLV